MAAQEMEETGVPETVEVKDPIPWFSQKEVIVCDGCGKGFLNWIPGGVDTDPLWVDLGAGVMGYMCGGALMLIKRPVAIEIADRIAIMYAGRIVESGPVHDILRDPGHPYTRGLLA